MNLELQRIVDLLDINQTLNKDEYLTLIKNHEDEELRNYLAAKAMNKKLPIYGNKVFTRGLIEFTNICKNDCFYCGIRASNKNCNRYRLSKEDILECCKQGYELGFKTFVLQGGEDPYYSDDMICDIVSSIKKEYPECALTLSIGEKDKESYQRYYDAGADRYLLRHESANEAHYNKLHPSNMSLSNRKECLYNLKEIGYQVGCGIMVGSPYQTYENIVEDIFFMQDLKPHMIGIGPFIPHVDTIFKDEQQGSLTLTLTLLSILRLTFPHVLLPATTALGTIDPKGREMGIKAGGNVVMPNLSPVSVRKKYMLYNDKICTDEEAAECRGCLNIRMHLAGHELVEDRGDYKE